MTTEELRAQVEEVSKHVAKSASEKAERMLLEAQLSVVSSDAYQQALINKAVETHKQECLNSYIKQCEVIISSNPVMDKVTRSNKRWNGRPVFGLGKDIELLHNLCTGILYSVEQHKLLMLGVVGVNLISVELFVNSLGRTAYYSDNDAVIVEEVPTDLESLKGAVLLLSQELGLALDTSNLTEEVLEARSKQAYVKASRAALEAELVPDVQFTMGG